MRLDLDPMDVRLLALARGQQVEIDDPGVRACWYVVVEAIDSDWLHAAGGMSVHELIEDIEAGRGTGAQEYWIEPEGDEVIASLVTSEFRCSSAGLVQELRTLDARIHGLPEPAPGPIPAPEAVRVLMARLLDAEAAPDIEATARMRQEAHDLLEQLAEMPDTVEADTRRALEGLSEEDRARLAEALRAFADWAEHPRRGGSAVDDTLRFLDTAFGRLLPGKRAEEKARDQRIADSAKDAIARRLGRRE